MFNGDNYEVITTITTSDGVGILDKSYTEAAKHSAEQREKYYLRYLQKQIEKLSNYYAATLTAIPVITSGMASSNIGIKELKYAPLPFKISGEDMVTEWIQPSDICHYPVLLLSGVLGDKDVMRGEETQLTGLQYLMKRDTSKGIIYIFPGTHSKHIYADRGKIQAFNTYITGELFALLCQHSILKDSISDNRRLLMDADEAQSFVEGVKAPGEAGLLNALFTIRTNWLFSRFTKELNYYFLSGLLIGEELRSLRTLNKELVLSAEGSLLILYQTALQVLGLSDISTILPAEIAEQGAIVGQIEIYKKIQTHE